MKYFLILLISVVMVLLSSCAKTTTLNMRTVEESTEQSTTLTTNKTNDEMREITSMELVLDMGMGWNLGNSLEACGDWIKSNSISDFEKAWGNPLTTKAMIDEIKKAGFKTVRIPVAWSNLIGSDYTIHPQLMNRVEEVVNYVLDNEMYAIVNIHWDNGWFSKFSTEYDESMNKYTKIWDQITTRFKDYPDYLIFESLNEEGHFDDLWNRYGGGTGANKAEAYGILNNINQTFVDLVRQSGGNNTSRHLLIAGYATDIDLTVDSYFKVPKDPINRVIISVHYYTPSTFTILENDASWGKSAFTWGTEREVNQVKTDMIKLKTRFLDKGIPVIIGEYGSTKVNKDVESVRNYLTVVNKTVYELGMVPILWDPGTHFNRSTLTFSDEVLILMLQESIIPLRK